MGGERGLRQFVEKGDVKISPERQDEFSPLLVAGFVGSIVVAVALLVNQGEDAAEVQVLPCRLPLLLDAADRCAQQCCCRALAARLTRPCASCLRALPADVCRGCQQDACSCS